MPASASVASVQLSSAMLRSVVCAYAASDECRCEPLEEEELAYTMEPSMRENEPDAMLPLLRGNARLHWKGRELTLWQTEVGEPITARPNADRESVVHEVCVIRGASLGIVHALVDAAEQWRRNVTTGKINVFAWHTTNEYWRRLDQLTRRSFDTIVLKAETRRRLLDDVSEFVSPETRAWFSEHAIPYRRGYLLHGPPGTGKSTIIHGLATRLDTSIFRINLVGPKMCDDSLQQAIQRVDAGALIVFEDVDALFGPEREKTEASAVTFSGLLNAIDGIGNTSKGTLFVFTTNHPERLDSALTRKGRVDLKLEIGCCSFEQSHSMFLRFYPGCDAEATQFAQRVAAMRSPVTPADLQDHFIVHRTSAASAAVDIHLEQTASETTMWS
ncbi:MAG: hypothetical protein CMP83_08435 [Gammaproteobacteria bacterium]|nr:hypothetical protein [Gammaproteobacteria bacterium]